MSNLRWIRDTDVTSSEIGDELALLEPDTRRYFTLNQTGAVVWQLLSEPQRTAEIVQSVSDKFDIAATDCESDIQELITELSNAGLIREA